MVKPLGPDNKRADYRKTGRGELIESSIGFKDILEVALEIDFMEVVSAVAAKGFIAKTRDDAAWQMGLTDDSEDDYITFTNPAMISVDMAIKPGEVLFYARLVSGTGTLEVLFVD